MDPFDDVSMPPPSAGGCLFQLAMFAAPLVGYRYLGLGGLLGGLALMNLAVAWFFFVRRPAWHGVCEACGRRLINRRKGTVAAERLGMPGVFMRYEDLMSGRMAPGSLCLRCGRVYCGCSHPQAVCMCGSQQLQTIAVEYTD